MKRILALLLTIATLLTMTAFAEEIPDFAEPATEQVEDAPVEAVIEDAEVPAEDEAPVEKAVKKPTKITLSRSKTLTLKHARTYELDYTIEPESAAGANVTWSTSNKNVATVSQKGVITAVGKGSCTITVKTSNGKKDTLKVNVKADSVNWNDDGPSKYNWRNDLYNQWDIWFKGVNIISDTKMTVDIWVLNGFFKKIKYIKPLDVEVYYDGELIGSTHIKKLSTSCASRSTKVMTLTFTGNDIKTKLSKIKLEDRDLLYFIYNAYAHF